MTEAFRAFKINDHLYWVGAIDWQLRNFHGYLTSRGTTYNAFLLLSDRVTLIDTVKPAFAQEMMARIASVIDPKAIDVVISNHAEMDHSGALPWLLEQIGDCELIASAPGKKALDQHFHWDQEIRVVKDGERVDLGKHHLRFVEARMLHWPDSMFTYIEEDEILFTNDAFGMHLASTERYADQLDPSLTRYELAKYFANILLPFAKRVSGQIAKLEKYEIAPKMIAPDHGPIFRKPEEVVELISNYRLWAEQKPTPKAVIVYDTMWQSTAKMAAALADGIAAEGVRAVLMPLEGSHRSDIATELLEAGALIVGSPTMNANIYPTVADAMTYVSGLKRRNLIGASFGSHGWNGKAVKDLDAMLTNMGVELVQPGMSIQYVPKDADLVRCHELGVTIANTLKEKA